MGAQVHYEIKQDKESVVFTTAVVQGVPVGAPVENEEMVR